MDERKKGLNLGCGNKHIKSTEEVEWINIDCNALAKPDIVMDLNDATFDLPDNSVDWVYTTHTLEHIRNFVSLMDEIHRVCKNRAGIYIKVPPAIYEDKPFEGAFRDPTHVRLFTERTFDYFDKTTPEGNLYNFPFFKVISSKITKEGVDPELEVKLVVVK